MPYAPCPMTYAHEYLIFLTKDIVYLAGTSDRKELLSGAIDLLPSQAFRRARMREFG